MVGRTTILATESFSIAPLRQSASPERGNRIEAMRETAGAYSRRARRLPKLREAAEDCRACPLWQTGTQTVFGEGAADRDGRSSSASSPATRRTRRGGPFVGPAGRVLDEALELAGIDRSTPT